jgi:hypothetical protein
MRKAEIWYWLSELTCPREAASLRTTDMRSRKRRYHRVMLYYCLQQPALDAVLCLQPYRCSSSIKRRSGHGGTIGSPWHQP